MKSGRIIPGGGLLNRAGGLLAPGGGLLPAPPAGPIVYDFGIGNNGTFASQYATDEWLMQATVSPVPNNVGSETLVNTGGELGASTTGISGRLAWETDSVAANGDFLLASGTTAGDSDSVDFAFRYVFKNFGDWAAGNFFGGKWLGGVGWWVQTFSVGRLALKVDDGPTQVTATHAADNSTAAWVEIKGWYDQSAQVIYISDNAGGEVNASTAGLGSLSNLGSNGVNTIGTNTVAGQERLQFVYAGCTIGANSQNFYDETVVLPT